VDCYISKLLKNKPIIEYCRRSAAPVSSATNSVERNHEVESGT